MIKKILQRRLASVARQILKTHKPEIIGVTGSVGKTSAKEAIVTVLSGRFRLRGSEKNYNNEFGLPLTVIGAGSPGRSASGWLETLSKARSLASDRTFPYPEMLVLEMGIDHPGDMDYLTSIAEPQRAVITLLGTAHAEFFPSVSELHKEKLKLADALHEGGIFIYNHEDERLRSAALDSTQPTLGYGFSDKADVSADSVTVNLNPERSGIAFKLRYEGASVPAFLSGMISRTSLLSALAGAAVGFSYGMNGIEIAERLKEYRLPPGRMNLISGRDCLIIDDTYNSSPEAALAGLETIAEIPKDQYGQVWIVLGDMRELGQESIKAHERVGRACAQHGFSRLVTVGEEARRIADGAEAAGMDNDSITVCADALEAADFLEKNVNAGDLVFIKGSQAVRLERIVKRLMNEPEKANELLVRQGGEWAN